MTSLGLKFPFHLLALLFFLWLHSEAGCFCVLQSALVLYSYSLNNHSKGRLHFPHSYSQHSVQAYLKLIVTGKVEYMKHMLDWISISAVELGLEVQEAFLEVLTLRVELWECIPDGQTRIISSRLSTPWFLNIMRTLVSTFNIMQSFI